MSQLSKNYHHFHVCVLLTELLRTKQLTAADKQNIDNCGQFPRLEQPSQANQTQAGQTKTCSIPILGSLCKGG